MKFPRTLLAVASLAAAVPACCAQKNSNIKTALVQKQVTPQSDNNSRHATHFSHGGKFEDDEKSMEKEETVQRGIAMLMQEAAFSFNGQPSCRELSDRIEGILHLFDARQIANDNTIIIFKIPDDGTAVVLTVTPAEISAITGRAAKAVIEILVSDPPAPETVRRKTTHIAVPCLRK